MITLTINGEQAEIEFDNLGQLLASHKKDNSHYAVALNEMFISKSNYFKTRLQSGDQIEIVQPMQGG